MPDNDLLGSTFDIATAGICGGIMLVSAMYPLKIAQNMLTETPKKSKSRKRKK